MIGVLTCAFLIVLAGLSAEAVRASCRRRLMTPLTSRAPVSPESPSLGGLELVGAPDLG